MTSTLRRLFDEIIKEAERRPEFGRRLAVALTETPPPGRAGTDQPKRVRRNRRAPGVLDPFDVFAQGEQALRNALQNLSLDQLKDIVSHQAMDSSKRALKWRAPERLVDLIVVTVRSRMEKGDAFKRDFSARGTDELNHRKS